MLIERRIRVLGTKVSSYLDWVRTTIEENR